MKKKDGALDSPVGRRPNELDSKGAGAMGTGVADGGGSSESNQEGASARRSHSGVGGGVRIEPHGSCTRFHGLSELDIRWNGVDGGGGGGGGGVCDPPVS